MMSVRSQVLWKPLSALALSLLLAGCDALMSPQHRLMRARAELDAGDWGRAAIELRKLVQADPNNSAAWLLLARWSLDVGLTADARVAIERAQKARAPAPELDSVRVQLWLQSDPKALIEAAAHPGLALPEPERSVAIARAYNLLQQPDHALAVLQRLGAARASSIDAQVTAAEALAREGRTDLALRQLDSALASDPNAWAAHLLQGQIFERRGRFPDAESSLSLALQRMPASTPLQKRMEALVALTESQLSQSKVEEATQTEAPLEKLAPHAPAVELLAGRLQLAQGNYVEGIADLERAVADAPTFVQARMLLATAQLRRGNLEQAQVTLEQVLQQTPDNATARKLLADVRLKLNEPEDALRALTPALGAQVMDPQLYTLLNAVESRVGDPNSVLQALERSLRAHPDNRTLRLNLADAYLSANRPKDALQLLQGTEDQAADPRRDTLLLAAITAVQGPAAASAEADRMLAAHAHDPEILNLAAAFFGSHGQPDRARVLLLQALAARPHDVTSLVNLARVDSQKGDVQAAEGDLRRALDEDPSNLQVRIALADVLIHRKGFTDAREILQAGNAAREPDLQVALARVALARADLKEANAALDRAAALQPSSGELENRAGMLLLAAKQPDAALVRFRKATQLVPDSALFWFNTAQAQLELKQPAAARQSLDKANQLQPEWVSPVSALTVLDLQARNFSSALERVKQFAAKHPDDSDALVLQGDTQQVVGQFGDAIASYSQALRRRPEAAIAGKLYEARSRAKLRDPEQPLQAWLAEHPQDYAIRMVLGNYYLAQRQLREAQRQFQTIVEQTPNDVVALNNLAWVYEELQDSRAQEVGERAYKLAPASPAVDDTLGWILARKHATDRALALLTQATSSGSADPDMQYHYAYALAQAGKRAQARAVLSKVLAGKQTFDSRRDAERLFANIKA
ncbi:MAG TPA: XrtA/PEP-CTERM system TPR-repeat protein PrsT [Steroidobacteraceae bacterium]|nr:XrtA/PEP-CTERM system TPR-repeat protein PrsT [Steroidobacteraceae bacterium]